MGNESSQMDGNPFDDHDIYKQHQQPSLGMNQQNHGVSSTEEDFSQSKNVPQPGKKIKAFIKGHRHNHSFDSDSGQSTFDDPNNRRNKHPNQHSTISEAHQKIILKAQQQKQKIQKKFQEAQAKRLQFQQHNQQQQLQERMDHPQMPLHQGLSDFQQSFQYHENPNYTHQPHPSQNQYQSGPNISHQFPGKQHTTADYSGSMNNEFIPHASFSATNQYETQNQQPIQADDNPFNQLTDGMESLKLNTQQDRLQSAENRWEHAWEEDTGSEDEEERGKGLAYKSVTPKVPVDHLYPSTNMNLIHQSSSITLDVNHSTNPMVVPLPTPPQLSQMVIMTPNLEGEQKVLSEQCDLALQQGPEGVAWDLMNKPGRYEKPNVSAFLPMLRVLGKGSFGKVVLVKKNSGKEEGCLFAMKILKKSHLLKRGQINRTRTERKVLSMVDHPFIMKLHFAFQTEDKLFLVLDYCAGGELFFHLTRHRRFSESWTRFYAAELLLTLGHLHSKGIIYRDLKPENILLDSEGHIKLGDFGLAKANIKHPYKGAMSTCGTPEYMAPEVLQSLGHGFCVDYWGLGMLTYEMMTGLPPWYTENREQLYRRLQSAPLQIPSFFSPQVASFVISLLQRDPRRRLGVRGVKTAVSHEFFRGLNFRDVITKRIRAPIQPCEGWNDGNKNAPDDRRNDAYSDEIEKATANFEKSFTRMAVHSDACEQDDGYDSDALEGEELNENTFVGYTFDEDEEDQPPLHQTV